MDEVMIANGECPTCLLTINKLDDEIIFHIDVKDGKENIATAYCSPECVPPGVDYYVVKFSSK